jgi:hypothetical protein
MDINVSWLVKASDHTLIFGVNKDRDVACLLPVSRLTQS